MKEIIVYTINNCGYCEAAKSFLKSLDLTFKEINITHDQQQRLDLLAKTNHRTMPQIFIDGQFIGGYTELKANLTKPPRL